MPCMLAKYNTWLIAMSNNVGVLVELHALVLAGQYTAIIYLKAKLLVMLVIQVILV